MGHVREIVGAIQRFGETDAFLAVGDPFLELSLPGEHRRQIGADRHRSRSGESKPLAAQITFEQFHDVQETVLGPSIVPIHMQAAPSWRFPITRSGTSPSASAIAWAFWPNVSASVRRPVIQRLWHM